MGCVGYGERIAMSKMPTILVVEMEKEVRMTFAEMLYTAGYQVISAGSGEAALIALEADRENEIEMVTSGSVLPDMTGFELARRILEDDPSKTLLLITGGPPEDSVTHGHLVGFKGVLMKPVEINDLIGMVAELLSK